MTKVIPDVSNTLVKQTAGDQYDKTLAKVKDEVFGEGSTIKLEMSLGIFGNTFPDHIKTILQNEVNKEYIQAFLSENTEFKSEKDLSVFLIDNHIRQGLIHAFSDKEPSPIEGIDKFINYLSKNNNSNGQLGIPLTGDLGGVAKRLLACEGLNKHFPYVTCGDGHLIFNSEKREYDYRKSVHESRIAQLESSFSLLNKYLPLDKGERLLFIDDAFMGVKAMKDFVEKYSIPNTFVIGVTTGSSEENSLYEAGADIVLPNVGHIDEI